MKEDYIPRDLSWLGFNARVLQEAKDKTVPLIKRIGFLGIFSNNLDEFFRVRAVSLNKINNFHFDLKANYNNNPIDLLNLVNKTVINLQNEFLNIWRDITNEMKNSNVFILPYNQINENQKLFIKEYFEKEVEIKTIPIIINKNFKMFYCSDNSLYLAVSMKKKNKPYNYTIIEIPDKINRFLILPPSKPENTEIILLEDIITFNLPFLFQSYGYTDFTASTFKVTRNADFDIEALDSKVNQVETIKKGIQNRRTGKLTRFVYESKMDKRMLNILISILKFDKNNTLIPGQRIHNFKDFMNFPNVFSKNLNEDNKKYKPKIHYQFTNHKIFSKILKKDIMLCFPYHSFRSVIDLLIESAMDPTVYEINISIYRLAKNSNIINALVNAARNGKKVYVILEIKARFNESENIFWKEKLEQEGVNVLLGYPNKKVHAKAALIKKILKGKKIYYGFISTGNLNENTAKLYVDNMLMTANKSVMNELDYFFNFFKKDKKNLHHHLLNKKFNHILLSPSLYREEMIKLIDFEINQAKNKKKSKIILKLNALNDSILIDKLVEAAENNVKIFLIVRGVYSLKTTAEFSKNIIAISIVDEYLEHARINYFYHGGTEHFYLSSADWMVRNLEHRFEIAVKIADKSIQQKILKMLQWQLRDNVKARILDNNLLNHYQHNNLIPFRSQKELFNLFK